MDESLNSKVFVKIPSKASEFDGSDPLKPNRYKWLSLDLTEPNLGVPVPSSDDTDYDIVFPTTFTNSYGISTIIFNDGEYLSEPESGANYNDLKIDIWFDTSSTSNPEGGNVFTGNTRQIFQQFSAPTTTTGMFYVSGLLKDKLLPFYNNDTNLLNQNVQIRYVGPFRGTAGGERTLSWAASSLRLNSGTINPGNRKIVIIFCDESNVVYHAEPLNVLSPTTQSYITDYDQLTAAYQERGPSQVTSKVYHVVIGREPQTTTWANNYWDFLNAITLPGAGGVSYASKNFVNYSQGQHTTFSIDRVYRGATISHYVNTIMRLLKQTTTSTIPNGYGYPGSYFTESYFLTSDLMGFRGWASKPPVLESGFSSLERPELKTTSTALEDLLYIEPKLTTFTINNKITEFLQPGEASNTSLLRWTINKKNHMAMNSYTIQYGSKKTVLFKSDMFKIQNVTLEVPYVVPGSINPGNILIRTYTAGTSGAVQPALLKPGFSSSSNTTITGVLVESSGVYNTPHIDIKFESIADRSLTQPNLGFMLLLKDNYGLWDTLETSKNLLFNGDLRLIRGSRSINSHITTTITSNVGILGYAKGIVIPSTNSPVGNYTVEQKDSSPGDFAVINTPFYQRISTNITSVGTTPLHLLQRVAFGLLLTNGADNEYPPKIDTHFGKTVNISFYARASTKTKIFIEHQVHSNLSSPFNFWTPTIHQIYDLTTEWKKYTFTFTAPTEQQVRNAAYNPVTQGPPTAPTYPLRTLLPPVSTWCSQVDVKLFWSLSGLNQAGNYAPNRPPYIGQSMTLQELSAITESFITNGYYDIANVTYLVGGKEFNYFNPLSSKNVSFDIGELIGSTTMPSTTSFGLTGADWKNNTDAKSVSATTTGYVYYGISTSNYLNITEADVLSGVNFTSRGAFKSLTNNPARSYRIDCSVDPVNAPNGYYYYIAYPAYLPNIQTIINNFNVTNRETTLTLSGEYVNDLPYKLTISNNIQKGVIPITIN